MTAFPMTVEGELKKATLHTCQLAELEPEQREAHWIAQQVRDKDFLDGVRRCRLKMSSTSEPGGSPPSSPRSTAP